MELLKKNQGGNPDQSLIKYRYIIMQLSPVYRAVLTACPDLSFIYNFKAQLGRGRCSWVHGITKTGQKISRFLKKGLVRFHTWISDTEYVSLGRDRLYEVSVIKNLYEIA